MFTCIIKTFLLLQIVVFACVIHVIVAIIVTDSPPTSTEYNYWYNIIDPTTGDTKSAQEIRQGDIVKGSYSVIDPDGTKRTVDYTAGGKLGFKAVIRNEPSNNHLSKRNYNAPVRGYLYPAPEQAKAPMLSTSNFIKYTDYFTPGNDTPTERNNFNNGEFFIPNYMH